MAESDRTALEVAKLARVPGTHRVSSHLYLLVRPAKKGGLRASWAFRFEQHGKATWMGLGSTKVFALAEARERARRARQLLADKVNPLTAKRQHADAVKLEAAKALTFGAAAQQYLAKQRQGPGLGWNAKHAAQWRTTFEGSSRQGAATAAINDLPVPSIDTALALKVLEPLISTPETASRVRGRCEKVIDWAIARGYRAGPNPFAWQGHLKQLLPELGKRAVQHHAALPYADLPAFMAELRQRQGVSARALEFNILCATRTSETINAAWGEIEERERCWRIPAVRMKGGKEHRVPLADRAVELLKSLPREDGTPFLFIGARRGKPLSNMAMLELLKGMRPGLTVHGFRSTFMDWAHERSSFAKVAIDMALAHKVGDAVEAAYRRGDLFEKRRQLMDAWAHFCASPAPQPASENIVHIRR
jgi:integrase